MYKALRQNISETARSYRLQVYKLLKDAHNSYKSFFVISQPCFLFTPSKKHVIKKQNPDL